MTLRQLMLRYVGWVKPRASDIPTSRPFDAPSIWRVHFNVLCAQFVNAGLHPKNTSYDGITWYICDEIPTWLMNGTRPLNGATYDPRTCFAGVWFRSDNSITLLASQVSWEALPLHEMMHYITQSGEHKPEWFNATFGTFTGEQAL